jgi:hypothetical protein
MSRLEETVSTMAFRESPIACDESNASELDT